jgi:hypothetical protein
VRWVQSEILNLSRLASEPDERTTVLYSYITGGGEQDPSRKAWLLRERLDLFKNRLESLFQLLLRPRPAFALDKLSVVCN